jgi:hypothetical protein
MTIYKSSRSVIARFNILSKNARITAWIIALCGVFLIVGCIVVPLPPGQRVYVTEHEIKELSDITASRDKVLNALGHPERQYESDISYRACRKGAGVIWVILIPYAETYFVDRSDMKCFELILHFDNYNRLTSYDKYPLDPPFSYNYKTPNVEALPTIRAMAEKGLPESQWRLYYEYGQKPGDIIWLCRSADGGYAKAQLHTGKFYWNAPMIDDNRIKAYVWYRLAATGDKLQGLLHDESTQSLATKEMKVTEKILTREQLEEAELLYSDWQPGQCELELGTAITGN